MRYQVLTSINDSSVYFNEYESSTGAYITNHYATFSTHYGSRINDAWNYFFGYANLVIPNSIYSAYKTKIDAYIVSSGRKDIYIDSLPAPCVPLWVCELPLTGLETDGCGNKRPNPACTPPQVGSISFVSTPPGAEIFIDGAYQGVMTPNAAANVPVGTHSYTLRLAGYNDVTGTVSVILNQTAAVTATLIAACTPVWKCEIPLTGLETDGCGNTRPNPACIPPQVGSISFVSTPAGADIFIDGAYQGVKTPNTAANVPVGTHSYTLRLAGYNDVTGTVSVILNQTAAVTATLTPGCVPAWKCDFPLNGNESDGCGHTRANPACVPLAQIGNISFVSTPAGAGIFLDGHDQGACLLYTSDAADDLLCVDLGGRRIIKKKKKLR